jgi:hypothetical protein
MTTTKQLMDEWFTAVLENDCNKLTTLLNMSNLLINCRKDDETKQGLTALHIACKNNSFDMMRWLLQNNADYTLETTNGYRVIHIAAESGNIHMINLLLDAGENVNIMTNCQWKYKPIHLASIGNHTEAVRLLLLAMEEQSENVDSTVTTCKRRVSISTQTDTGSKLIARFDDYFGVVAFGTAVVISSLLINKVYSKLKIY